jgi:tellurium resistance protein TerZ
MFGFGSNKEGVDLDASAVLFASNNQVIDVIYFGKLISSDGAVKHSGDDLIGDTDGDDGLDNEIITVNLNLLNPGVDKIVFLLNSYKGQDFATIPFANIRLYEGTPDRVQSVFAKFDIAKDPKFAGNVSMVIEKLYKKNNQWKFETIAMNQNKQYFEAILKSGQSKEFLIEQYSINSFEIFHYDRNAVFWKKGDRIGNASSLEAAKTKIRILLGNNDVRLLPFDV